MFTVLGSGFCVLNPEPLKPVIKIRCLPLLIDLYALRGDDVVVEVLRKAEEIGFSVISIA